MVTDTKQESGQTLTCVDCSAPFIFSDGELKFYQGKGLSIPKRCKPCRDARRQKAPVRQGDDFSGM